MPFRSTKQRRYMWARHPEIARRWTEEHGSKIVPGNDKKRKKKHSYKDAAARRSMNHKKKKRNKSSKMTGMSGY